MARKIRDRTPFTIEDGGEVNGLKFLESSLIVAVGWYTVRLAYRKFESEIYIKPEEIPGKRLDISDGGRTVGAFKILSVRLSPDSPQTIDAMTLEACE